MLLQTLTFVVYRLGNFIDKRILSDQQQFNPQLNMYIDIIIFPYFVDNGSWKQHPILFISKC